MILHDLKRQRRLHRILNGTTNPSDWKGSYRWWLPKMIVKTEGLKLTWYQKLIQWLQKLTKKFSR